MNKKISILLLAALLTGSMKESEKRRIRESAEAPRKQRRPPKSLRQIAKEFWDDLD